MRTKKQKLQSITDALRFEFERIYDEFENLSDSLDLASGKNDEYLAVSKLINIAVDEKAKLRHRISFLELKDLTN